MISRIFLFLSFLLIPVALFASADGCIIDGTSSATQLLSDCQPSGSVDGSVESIPAIKEWIKRILLSLISLGSLLSVAMIVYAGFQYTTVFENEKKAGDARKTGIAALVGLVIMLVTFPFVDMIVTFIYNLSQ